MRSFADLPLRDKFQRLVTASSAIAILLIIVALTIIQAFVVKDELENRVAMISSLIGAQVAPALLFNNPASADNDLKQLQAIPYITSLEVYQTDGSLFSRYQKNQKPAFGSSLGTIEPSLGFSHLISVDGDTVGNIKIQVAAVTLYQPILAQAMIVLLTGLLAMGASLFVFRRLQRVVTEPITSLCTTMESVTKHNNYALRAEKKGNDEIGSIVGSFNNMLNTIELRDQRLEEYRTQLIKLIDEQSDEIRSSHTRLEHMVYHDSLTNLPNRNLLEERLSQALTDATKKGALVGVLFVGVDNFKLISDTFGYAEGDKLLLDLSNRLGHCVRKSDTIARVNSDEFVIILDNIESKNNCSQVSNQLMTQFAVPFDTDGKQIVISSSVGIATFPNDGEDVDSLLRNANSAMHKAKEEGRGRVQFYTQEFTELAQERVTLEIELHKALSRNELEIHYQPQVDISTGELIGAEALLRWNHPVLGIVSPAKFIPLAEDTGLIEPIGLWVLQEVCRKLATWESLNLPQFNVAVNVSGFQLTRGNLAQDLRNIIEETGCNIDRVELEVTEGFFITNPIQAAQTLHDLKKVGAALAIDDFGTGYSSLSYLKRMPIDKLKIDQSFVRDIPNDSNDIAIAKAVIALAKSMQLKVVAEGVETEAQLDFMRKEGCDHVQGYLFSRPLPLRDFEELLNNVTDFHRLVSQGLVDDA